MLNCFQSPCITFITFVHDNKSKFHKYAAGNEELVVAKNREDIKLVNVTNK